MSTKPYDGRINANALYIPLADESIQTCVTSPPYWGLRAYQIPDQIFGGRLDCDHDFDLARRRGGPANRVGKNTARPGRSNVEAQRRQDDSLGSFCRACAAWKGQLGLEPNPDLYVEHMVEIFREIWRVLRKDGTLWLNLGDSYAGSWGAQSRDNPGRQESSNLQGGSCLSGRQIIGHPKRTQTGSLKNTPGLKAKDLVGIPWRIAFALQQDGWWLRSDIIWSKNNCMPESTKDRPTRQHEYIFLMTKSARYYYNGTAIKEPASKDTHARYNRAHKGYAPPGQEPHHGITGPRPNTNKQDGHGRRHKGFNERYFGPKAASDQERLVKANARFYANCNEPVAFRNKRTVWNTTTSPYPEAHYATFPPDLITPCILAGSREGDFVLDPFGGSGTTAVVAERLNRRWVLLDLGYQDMQARRMRGTQKELLTGLVGLKP